MGQERSTDAVIAEELKIGSKIRELREKKLYTLQDLSTKTGFPKTLLSDIEKGVFIPPVATLLKLAKSLSVGMAYFFEDMNIGEKISITRKDDRARIKRRPHHHEEGEVDYIYESLETKRSDKHMEPLFVEFQPVATSDMVFVNHEGEEFLYILDGTVEFRTDDRTEILEPGDALYFDSDINHSFRSLNGKTAKAVVTVWNKI
jgi:transcriptional regulator with XRE-family HTH domain